jgi:hypothetical protein
MLRYSPHSSKYQDNEDRHEGFGYIGSETGDILTPPLQAYSISKKKDQVSPLMKEV